MNYKQIKQTILVFLMGILFSNLAIAQESTEQKEPSLIELKEACDDKVASACMLLAGRYFKGERITMNIVRAKKYFTEACTLGEKKSCELSKNMDKIMDDTNNRYTKGCEKGIVSDCATMGLLAFRGQMIHRNWKTARVYLTKACDQKDKMSCDLITGLNFVEKSVDACNKGDTKGCNEVGILYIKGDMEAEVNAEEAIKYFTKACDNGNSDGCSFLAKIYIKGIGVRPNIQKASSFFEKVCDRGDAKICMMLGSEYEKGNQLKEDHTKAKELYKKACDLGEKSGCSKYRELGI
ncbi:MAG TPA: sel1 repeat family protein [Arcobacter sp.]|nr:sel1 repeat family protein [Arcobacter sp.]